MGNFFRKREEVKIMGAPSILDQAFINVAGTMTNMAQNTADLHSRLKSFADRFYGKRFTESLDAITIFTNELIKQVDYFYDVQRDLAEWISAVEDFDNRSQSGIRPRQTPDIRSSLTGDGKKVAFTVTMARDLSTYIDNYCISIQDQMKKFKNDAQSLESIWRDEQYWEYMDHVEETFRMIENGKNKVIEFNEELKRAIVIYTSK